MAGNHRVFNGGRYGIRKSRIECLAHLIHPV